MPFPPLVKKDNFEIEQLWGRAVHRTPHGSPRAVGRFYHHGCRARKTPAPSRRFTWIQQKKLHLRWRLTAAGAAARAATGTARSRGTRRVRRGIAAARIRGGAGAGGIRGCAAGCARAALPGVVGSCAARAAGTGVAGGRRTAAGAVAARRTGVAHAAALAGLILILRALA